MAIRRAGRIPSQSSRPDMLELARNAASIGEYSADSETTACILLEWQAMKSVSELYAMSSNPSDNNATFSDEESLLEFPCRFPIKAFGLADEDFDALVVSLVRRHVPDLGESAVQKRLSNGGRYMSVTVTINATSRSQLDAIYRELTAESRVVMAL